MAMPAPTLILLPGLACDGELFRDQLPGLPGAVVSEVHMRCASLPAMATALLAQHPGPLALAGCSMGGMLALEVWRQAPQRVRGLALLGTTARADTRELLRLRSEAISLFEQGRMDEVLRANLPFAFFQPQAGGGGLVADYLAMIRRAGALQLIAQNRAVMAREDLRPVLAQVRCPTLVVSGDKDLLTPPDCAREIAAAVPRAQLRLLPDCGHMLSWEQPQALTQALLGWRAGLT